MCGAEMKPWWISAAERCPCWCERTDFLRARPSGSLWLKECQTWMGCSKMELTTAAYGHLITVLCRSVAARKRFATLSDVTGSNKCQFTKKCESLWGITDSRGGGYVYYNKRCANIITSIIIYNNKYNKEFTITIEIYTEQRFSE